MPVCQFGERQHELAANLELISGSGRFFAPPTPLEAKLGIDAALTPGDPRIWTLLGVPAPRGVTAGPRTFAGWPHQAPASAVPPFLVSLFVQYKRATYLTRTWANEWSSHLTSYWRVELAARQHRTLQRLERTVGSQAVVRYAAPRFWRHDEMWRLQASGAVLDNSLFVVPSAVQRRHQRLTWSRGVGLLGHSDSEGIPAETTDQLAAELRRRAQERRVTTARAEPPRSYLHSLAEAVAEVTPSRRRREDWIQEVEEQIAREPEVEPQAVEALAEMAIVAEAAHAARASWLVIAISEGDTETDVVREA